MLDASDREELDQIRHDHRVRPCDRFRQRRARFARAYLVVRVDQEPLKRLRISSPNILFSTYPPDEHHASHKHESDGSPTSLMARDRSRDRSRSPSRCPSDQRAGDNPVADEQRDRLTDCREPFASAHEHVDDRRVQERGPRRRATRRSHASSTTASGCARFVVRRLGGMSACAGSRTRLDLARTVSPSFLVCPQASEVTGVGVLSRVV